MKSASSSSFFSRKTFFQLLSYGVVGVYEYVAGYEIFHHVPLPDFMAFAVQSGIVGFTAFLMRKYWTFRVNT